MDQLPIEIITEIFRYLPRSVMLRCTLVCKQWYEAARDPCFNTPLEIPSSSRDYVLPFDSESRSLPYNELRPRHNRWTDLDHQMFERCKLQPTSFRVIAVPLVFYYLDNLTKHFHNVHHAIINPEIPIADVPGAYTTLSQSPQNGFGDLKNVTVTTVEILDCLKQCHCFKLFEMLPDVFLNMKYLILNIERRNELKESIDFIEATTNLIQRKFPTVIEIWLNLNKLPGNEVEELYRCIYQHNSLLKIHKINLVSNMQLLQFHKLADNQREIRDITFPAGKEPKFFYRLDALKHWSKLESLTITHINCAMLSEDFLGKLQTCKKLKSLNLSLMFLPVESGVSEFKLTSALHNFPRLRTFSLESTWKLLNLNINIESFALTIKSFPNLRELSIINLFNFNHEAMKVILTKCKQLRSFQIYSATELSDSGFVPNCDTDYKLPDLEVLTLYKCSALTDKSLIEGFKFENLRKLDLSGMIQITGVGLVAMTKVCRFIQVLKLDDCRCISDSAVVGLSENLMELRQLSLKGFYLTEDCLESIVENCKLIQSVDIFLRLLPHKQQTVDYFIKGVFRIMFYTKEGHAAYVPPWRCQEYIDKLKAESECKC